MVKAKKKKSSKEKLDEILDIAAEELIDDKEDDDLPFEKEIITPAQVTKELQACKPQTIQVTVTLPENTEEADFEFARATLFGLVQKASLATDGILGVCSETEHPRSYEVAGQLFKITADIVKEMVALRKTKAEINKFKLPGETSISPDIKDIKGGDTYILQGTTAEVLNAIKKSKEDTK